MHRFQAIGGWPGRALSALLALALLLAPAVVAATHGPGATLEAAATLAQDLAHGHSHDMGESGSHDAADHEHPMQAVLTGGALLAVARRRPSSRPEPQLGRGRAREGPRRPPRAA